MSKLKIAIIISTTRAARFGHKSTSAEDLMDEDASAVDTPSQPVGS
jgi:hypothetical protein